MVHPLALARLHARGQLAELGPLGLHFTPKEMDELLSGLSPGWEAIERSVKIMNACPKPPRHSFMPPWLKMIAFGFPLLRFVEHIASDFPRAVDFFENE